jgi:hypothetical protein
MYSEIKIYEAGPSPASVIVNELSGTLKYPVRRFTWSDPTRGDELPKMQAAGQHDRYKNIDTMLITMEGDILGSTTTEYWTNRKALLAVVLPKPGQNFRYHGNLQIKLDGDSETYWCNVDLEDRDTPTEAFYPTRTPFQFQWTNPYGYWRKLSNNAVAYI